jgi:protocatechuate 3,4-dioxygenase beta subunit
MTRSIRFISRPYLVATAAWIIVGMTWTLAPAQRIAPTPEVGSGPNHKSGAPYRAKLSPPFAPGRLLVVKGRARAADTGEALPGVVLDAYHADANGKYDLQGYNYRGRVITDENGYFEFETIRPQGYGGVAPHIHFKISRDGYRTLRTEMLFADTFSGDSRGNARDELMARIVERKAFGQSYDEATFDVVLEPAR